jgi:hypothetical protein
LKTKLSSSALGYAISFLLLVGLVCSAVLFISSVNKRIEINYLTKEHLIFDNIVAINYGAKEIENKQRLLVHVNGDTSKITVKNWGAFKIVTAKTFHRNQFVHKTAMVGYSDLYSYAVVYTPDSRQALKLCGETKINGTFYGSERGLERGHIAGKHYAYEKLIEGEMKVGEKMLPELHQSVKNITIESFIEDAVKIDMPIKDSIFSFENQTSLVTSINPVIITNKLKGNLIIHSFHSIEIKKEAQLENIIVIAPNVLFEKGFRGKVQVIAHEQVVLEEGVKLEYPSTIILNELSSNQTPKMVHLNQQSMVVGGILIVSQRPDFRNFPKLIIQNAVVGGLVYNIGETEVTGKIHGYTYTNNFSVRIGGGEYKNHIIDAEFSNATLPKELILPQWIKTDETKKTEIIKWL